MFTKDFVQQKRAIAYEVSISNVVCEQMSVSHSTIKGVDWLQFTYISATVQDSYSFNVAYNITYVNIFVLAMGHQAIQKEDSTLGKDSNVVYSDTTVSSK